MLGGINSQGPRVRLGSVLSIDDGCKVQQYKLMFLLSHISFTLARRGVRRGTGPVAESTACANGNAAVSL